MEPEIGGGSPTSTVAEKQILEPGRSNAGRRKIAVKRILPAGRLNVGRRPIAEKQILETGRMASEPNPSKSGDESSESF